MPEAPSKTDTFAATTHDFAAHPVNGQIDDGAVARLTRQSRRTPEHMGGPA